MVRTRSSKQSILTPKPNQTLNTDAPHPLPPGETTTARIPPEVLIEILKYASHEHKRISDLMVVCRRWHQIVEPLAYRQLAIQPDVTEQIQYIRRLVDRLEYCAHLNQYPREVYLELLRGPVILHLGIRLVQCCRKVEVLSFHGLLEAGPSPLLEAIASLPLRKLSLSGVKGYPSVNFIIQLCAKSTLQTLKVKGYGWSRHGYPSIGQPEDDSPIPFPDVLEKLLPPSQHGTSRLKTLDLSDPHTTPDVSSCLLTLPSALQQLTFRFPTYLKYAIHYTPDVVQRMIHPQSKSLKEIGLGSIPSRTPGRAAGIPDFSIFPELENLGISAYDVFSEAPVDASRKLAAPKLCQLILDCSVHKAEGFGKVQLKWMEDFLVFFPRTTLKEIRLLFGIGGREWPGDCVLEAKKAAAAHGISLAYSTRTRRTIEQACEAQGGW